MKPKRVRNKEQNARWSRKSYLRIKYGLTPEAYDAILQVQNGVCAICGGLNPGKTADHSLAVDHSHVSGKIRGLLCIKCNAGLGSFDDNIERMKKAIAYLELHKD